MMFNRYAYRAAKDYPVFGAVFGCFLSDKMFLRQSTLDIFDWKYVNKEIFDLFYKGMKIWYL